MGDKIEIILSISSPSIADLHSTITSILRQIDISSLDVYIYFLNPLNLNITAEINRLKNTNIKVITHTINAHFELNLTSGTVISQSYLYKAIHFLKHNPDVFVCPEYTFSKINDCPIITTIHNHNLPINCTTSTITDRSKLSSAACPTPRAKAIKNTCDATAPIQLTFSKYLKSLRTSKAFFLTTDFLPQNFNNQSTLSSPDFSKQHKFTTRSISIIKSISGKSKIMHRLFRFFTSWQNNSPADVKILKNKTPPYISNSMRIELAGLSNINYSLKGFESMNYYNITYEISRSSEELFFAFNSISPILTQEHYDYIMVLPWLISGGIDLFATNYLRTIAEISPTKRILVILTNNAHKSFTKEDLALPSNVDLLDLPKALPPESFKPQILDELVYSLISVYSPERLHIIASKIGYDCLIEHGQNIRKLGTKIIFSSYNYLTGTRGEYIGYTVQELPQAYMPGDIVTTDNLASKKLWVDQYGFLPDDILIHQQLFNITEHNIAAPSTKDGIRILWAAHVRPEKNPNIVPEIAAALQAEHIEIDCYGLFAPDNWADERNPLVTNLPNLHYCGPYNDFFTDIDLSKYDLFLYTSHADGTPNVILEAALAGLPIVSSAIGGIPEATKGKACLVHNSYSTEEFVNAIRQVISHQEASIKQAKLLQKELREPHSKQAFTAQVREMLERSK